MLILKVELQESSGITAISNDGSKITSSGGVIIFRGIPLQAILMLQELLEKWLLIYNYNPSIIQWIDIRSYTGGVEWGDFKIMAGITSANVNNIEDI